MDRYKGYAERMNDIANEAIHNAIEFESEAELLSNGMTSWKYNEAILLAKQHHIVAKKCFKLATEIRKIFN